ncbi:hypothetical protein B0H14DRAFT_2615100 [Mycena olivaceomarginata]|nr:hypothetical protein B0H14DRAFT_2615100 [Mycena olivaceomarginata]
MVLLYLSMSYLDVLTWPHCTEHHEESLTSIVHLLHAPSLKKSPPSLAWNLVAQLVMSQISFVRTGGGQDGEVVAIIAQSDTVLYHAIVAGLMTADLIEFTSGNAPTAARNVLPLHCRHVFHSRASAGETQNLNHRSRFALEIQEVPSLLDPYPNLGANTENCPFQPYPTKVSTTSLDDIAMYICFLGRYQNPKSCQRDPPDAQIVDYPLPLPGPALQCTHQPELLPGTLPITPLADNILEHMCMTKCQSLLTVPVMLTTWSESSTAVKYLKTLDRIVHRIFPVSNLLHFLLFAGRPLPQRIGDDLVKQGLCLISAYGATEFGAFSSLIPYEDNIKEWAWFRVLPLMKVRWARRATGHLNARFWCTLLLEAH